jgi:prefoldin subunit 5
MRNRNFDDGVAMCERQIQQLKKQRQTIDRMIDNWEKRKQSLIEKQQQQNDQNIRGTHR